MSRLVNAETLCVDSIKKLGTNRSATRHFAIKEMGFAACSLLIAKSLVQLLWDLGLAMTPDLVSSCMAHQECQTSCALPFSLATG